MDYSALYNAVASPAHMTPQQINENYNHFQELQKQGISISDLMSELADLKNKVTALESKPDKPAVDRELFSVMEAAVKDDPAVVSARLKAQEVKTTILREICCADPRYASALEDYSREVHAAYVRRTESRVLDLESSD